MWSIYSRGEDGVGQRQSLQVGHEAVGQEIVDGCDLRGGGWFNCEEEKVLDSNTSLDLSMRSYFTSS